jgi:hypothetical protein
MAAGPVPIKRKPTACPHLGLFGATLSLASHPEGHEWVCECGKQFVVVSNGGEGKRLVPRFTKPPATHPEETP